MAIGPARWHASGRPVNFKLRRMVTRLLTLPRRTWTGALPCSRFSVANLEISDDHENKNPKVIAETATASAQITQTANDSSRRAAEAGVQVHISMPKELDDCLEFCPASVSKGCLLNVW